MIPRIALVGLAGEFEAGFGETRSLLERAAQSLDNSGQNIIRTDIIIYNGETVSKTVEILKNKEFDIICVCLGTWSEDHHLLDVLGYFNTLVILWAFPGINTGSLCGAHQICCVLKELGRHYFYVYGEADDKAVADEIRKISKVAALRNILRHVKIGSVGGRVRGMAEIAYDELEIMDRTGVRIVSIDEDEFAFAIKDIPEGDAVSAWNDVSRNACRIASDHEACLEAMKYYLAMKKLVMHYKLEGISINCYPKYMGKICVGYSILSEEGIVCGCEGDINGTVAMKILYELTGMPIHNTDLLYPDVLPGTILFSHCGSGGFSLASPKDKIHFGPVRLADKGVCSLFTARPGKVTLMNLVGRKQTYRMSVIAGDAVECGMEFPGNPLKVKFESDVLQINKRIAENGAGHHWMGGYGDVSWELENFCLLSGIRYIRL